jgi:membrane-bound lytic murein transglycosylase B
LSNHAKQPATLTQLNNLTLKQFKKYGIFPKRHFSPLLKASLIALPLAHNNEYWLGFTNFQVIKRYNNSSLYAMAVYQLSELIEHYYQQEHPPHVHKK